MATPGIILLEGADSSGKSTLARYFVEAHGATSLHLTIRHDVWKWHVGALRLAIRRFHEGKLTVIDRHFHSELIYGPIFRGAPQYAIAARCFDRVLRRYGAVTVLCAPRDQRRQEARWEAGRRAGKHEHFDRVREVIARYADLRDGNVAHPGTNYVDQLIRFQDFASRDDVMVYDLDDHGRKMAGFSKLALERMRLLHNDWMTAPGDNLAGRLSAYHAGGTILVGEAGSPRAIRGAPRWPFADRDGATSAATWLNRAIHHLALREDRLVILNAHDRAGGWNGGDDRLPRVIEEYRLRDPKNPIRVIALGVVARDRLRGLGVDPVEVPHPQWHRRFRHAEGPVGYALRLQEAMRA